MKKNKGFTLIEIMAVLVILAVIALLVVPLVTGSIKDSKQKLYETQLENIKSGAKSYMINLDLPSTKPITVTLDDLQKKGLVDKDIKNPITGEDFNRCMLIQITKTSETEEIYEYEIIDENNDDCSDSSDLIMALIGSVNEQVVHNKPYVEPGIILETTKGEKLDLNQIRVEVEQYKNGVKIYGTNGNYNELATLIKTDDYYEYKIKYIYNGELGQKSVTRNVKVVDSNDLQCIIITGKKNENGWITDRQARILSINNNKSVQYSLSTTNTENYGTKNTIDIINNGTNINLYGYIRDNDGNRASCNALNLNYEIGTPSCSINIQGTKGSNNWYIGEVTANIIPKVIASTINQKGMSLSSAVNYNNQTSLKLTSGNGTVHGFVKDEAGKANTCSSSFKVDSTTTISATISGVLEGTSTGYTSGSIVNRNVVLISTIRPGTTTSGYSYQWYKDGVAIPGATGANYTATSNGNYRFSVTTGSGVVGYSNIINVNIDKVNPTVNYSIGGGTYNNYQTVTVTATDTNFSYMNVHVYKNGVAVAYNNNLTTNTFQVPLNTDGVWTVYTQAYDKAGNRQNQAPDNGGGWYYQTYTIDAHVDAASLTARNTAGAIVNSGTWTNTDLTVTLTGTSGLTLYYCIDANNTCTPNITYTGPFTHGTQGTTYIRYVANNGQKNSELGSYTAMIDKAQPTCSISLSGTKGNNNWYTSDVLTTLNTSNAASYGISSSGYVINSQNQLTYSTNGTVYGHVKSISGLNSNTCSNSLQIDKTGPVINDLSSTNMGSSTSIFEGSNAYASANQEQYGTPVESIFQIAVTASDPESGIDYYEFYGGSTLLQTGKSNTLHITSTELENIKVRVYNNAGIMSEKDLLERCDVSSEGACVSGSQTISYTCTSGRTYSTISACYVPDEPYDSDSTGGSGSQGCQASGPCDCGGCTPKYQYSSNGGASNCNIVTDSGGNIHVQINGKWIQ